MRIGKLKGFISIYGMTSFHKFYPIRKSLVDEELIAIVWINPLQNPYSEDKFQSENSTDKSAFHHNFTSRPLSKWINGFYCPLLSIDAANSMRRESGGAIRALCARLKRTN